MVESSNTLDMLMEGDPNEFILGMPRHKYFFHTKKRALIVTVSDYEALRENEGKDKYLDLPETIEDCKRI